MLSSGIVSVTFRQFSVDEIIEYTKKAGLAGIEWGGDVHVPHGDIQKAKYTSEKTKAAGLKIISYGSYYRVGTYFNPINEFKTVLNTAIALEAPNIRIWAGSKNNEDTDDYTRKTIVDEIKLISDIAYKYNVTITFEFHGGTLTNTAESAVNLIRQIDRKNVFLYWQPNQFQSFEHNILALKLVLPYLLNVHVFNWDDKNRYLLSDAVSVWNEYIKIIKDSNRTSYLLLEFVKNDDVFNFYKDSQVLRDLI